MQPRPGRKKGASTHREDEGGVEGVENVVADAGVPAVLLALFGSLDAAQDVPAVVLEGEEAEEPVLVRYWRSTAV